MTTTIRDAVVDFLAAEAVAIFEEGGTLGRVEYAIRTAASRYDEKHFEACSLDEQARAYALACRELEVARLPDATEVHPDGRRWPSDSAVVRSLLKGGNA